MHVACHFGQVNMVKFLLENGAQVNTTTKMGYTPLHQAAQQGHPIIIKILLEHGASPNAVTAVRFFPLLEFLCGAAAINVFFSFFSKDKHH